MTDVLRAIGFDGAATNRRGASPWRNADFVLLSVTAALGLLGALMISSATYRRLEVIGADPHQFVKRQVVYVVAGLVAMVVVARIDYRAYVDSAGLLYLGLLVSLVAVLFLGSVNKGARSWFEFGAFQIQPSEYAKVGVVVALAAYGSAQRMQLDRRRFFAMLGIAGVPAGLIYLEPDLGTALVFLVMVLAVVWVAGAEQRHMLGLAVLGVLTVIVAVRLGLLDPYQMRRLLVFINPDSDPRSGGFNVTQARIAIGSGGLTGKGLYQGTQTNFGYVPEQRTDFIFSAVGEQLGFVGAVGFLVLFGIACWRIWRIGASARDLAGTLLCLGVLAMFAFQVFQNIGMNVGIMPVTGIPLPFLSYGGSATMSMFMAMGLVLNVGMHRFR